MPKYHIPFRSTQDSHLNNHSARLVTAFRQHWPTLTSEAWPEKSLLLDPCLLQGGLLQLPVTVRSPALLLQPCKAGNRAPRLPRNTSKRTFQKDALRRVKKTARPEDMDGFSFSQGRRKERKYLQRRRTGGSPKRRALLLAQRLAYSSTADFFLLEGYFKRKSCSCARIEEFLLPFFFFCQVEIPVM